MNAVLHEQAQVHCATSGGGEDQELTTSFVKAFGKHPGGVALVTADAGKGPVAMTVTSLTSVSASPPVFLFSAAARSSSSPTLREAETVVAHFLSPEDINLARLGATSGIDRFEDDEMWERLPTGEPLFHTHGPWLRAGIIMTIDVNGSTVVLAEVYEASDRTTVGDQHKPGLTYVDRTWRQVDTVPTL